MAKFEIGAVVSALGGWCSGW